MPIFYKTAKRQKKNTLITKFYVEKESSQLPKLEKNSKLLWPTGRQTYPEQLRHNVSLSIRIR